MRHLCLWLVCTLAAGCTVVPARLGLSYQNRPDEGQSVLRPKYPVPRAPATWPSDKPTFIGLAISGGGSRSANFGMAVLGELDRIGVLQHVDAVSAVSGGSIPAAWLATQGTTPDWADRGREVAGHDYLLHLIGKLASPLDTLSRVFTDRDRTDTLAEVFDDVLFGGRRPTFADLGAPGPMRPAVYFNATDTTSGGRRFVFSDQAFFDALASDLSAYPLAWAMASSGAFPGIFNSVTMRRYRGDPMLRAADDHRTDHRYVHLIDGGAAENMGVETLIDLARQHHVKQVSRDPAAGNASDACMIIVVDAHVPNNAVIEGRQSDRRNVASTLLDLNFLDAIDAMFTSNRDSTLARLDIRRDLPIGRFDIRLRNAMQMVEYDVRPYARVGHFNIDHYVYKRPTGESASDRLLDQNVSTLEYAEPQRPNLRSFKCRSWHIALEGVQGIVPWRGLGADAKPLSPGKKEDQPVFAYRAALDRLTAQVSTNYRLSGPPHCSNELVQRSLYDVAHIAVRQDKASLDKVCGWFAGNGLGTEACRPEVEPLHREDLDLEPIRVPLNQSRHEQALDRFVQCRLP
ncbi:MAG: patatin-like phospholipase family protein [Ideonella sp.]|nr:patatin-like phospholipase family protein [Ideonella sp.]